MDERCPGCGKPMLLRPLERQTYEQRFCGVWYDCPDPDCRRTVFYPSDALQAQHAEMRREPSAHQHRLELMP
jgi:hypothetical protein